MSNLVQRFEGDNIKTQHGGKGSVFFSVPGFSFGLTAEYNKTLVSSGRVRDVNGRAAEQIGRNIEKAENVMANQNAVKRGGCVR